MIPYHQTVRQNSARAEPAPEENEPAPQYEGSLSIDGRAQETLSPDAEDILRALTSLNASEEKCWVCYDPAGPRNALISPCHCSLRAHEKCLLAWLNTYQSTPRQDPTPRCPACQEPYIISESTAPFATHCLQFVRSLDHASLYVALAGFGGGAWIVLAEYAKWAIQTLAGPSAAAEYLRRRGAWRVVDLPLVPLILVFSRTSLIDPLLPLLHIMLVTSHGRRLVRYDPLGLDDKATVTFPPSPAFIVCIAPWIRLAYLRLRARAAAAILGTKPSSGWASLMAALNDDAPEPAPEGADDVAIQLHDDGGERSIRVGLRKATSFFVGALLFPAIASASGSALVFLATRPWLVGSVLLRRILGIPASFAPPPSAGGLAGALAWARAGLSGAPSYETRDPILYRNLLGGGVYVVIRDLIWLAVSYQERRRQNSRRIVSVNPEERIERVEESERGTAASAGGSAEEAA